MAQTDSGNAAPQPHAAPQPPDNKTRFSFLRGILGFIREISVPVFLAFLGWIFSQSLANQSAELQKSLAKQSTELQESLARQSDELQRATTQQSIAKDYVGIAVSILEKPEDEGYSDLRDWAVDLLRSNSPLKFTQQQLDELKKGGLGPQRLAELSGAILGPLFTSPDLKKVAMTKTTSPPLSGRPGEHRPPDMYSVLLYDLHTGREISQLDAGSGNWPFEPSKVVWSRDSLKLLVWWQSVGRVIAFDVTEGKQLGYYQDEFPPNSVIESLNFGDDARSVIIKRVNGKIDVWQLPITTP
jgi:hypothetical protein